MPKKVIPLRDRVVIKRDKKADKIEGTILFAAEVTKEEPELTGTVVASGPGLTTPHGHFLPNELKSGQKVLFPKQAGDIDSVKSLLTTIKANVDALNTLGQAATDVSDLSEDPTIPIKDEWNQTSNS